MAIIATIQGMQTTKLPVETEFGARTEDKSKIKIYRFFSLKKISLLSQAKTQIALSVNLIKVGSKGRQPIPPSQQTMTKILTHIFCQSFCSLNWIILYVYLLAQWSCYIK